MKRILPLIEKYRYQQQEITESNQTKTLQLQKHIDTSRELLHKLRFNIRDTKFNSFDEEIYFFKQIKPKIYADYIFFTNQLNYFIRRPNATIAIQKHFINNELKKLENKKRRNIEFYRYYIQNKTFLDQAYFTRNNSQLILFFNNSITALDPEFYTSHNSMAAEVIAYNLLTNFYKSEIKKIKDIKNGLFSASKKVKTPSMLKWTGTKTDLVELIYALKVSGTINAGKINIKEIVTALESTFNIEIPNYYKTYSEIKNRGKERTKFLNLLKTNLMVKLELDDGM